MRLIDADDLKAKIMIDAPGFMEGGSSITKAFIMAMVGSNAATPTIDAVPVVRCKDCRYWLPMNSFHEDYHPGNGECELNCWVRQMDWFCADGKPYCSRCGCEVEIGKDLCDKCMYEAQIEMEEHERMYEQTYNPEDGSM